MPLANVSTAADGSWHAIASTDASTARKTDASRDASSACEDVSTSAYSTDTAIRYST